MANFLSDTLDEASNTALASHSPGTGGAWTKHPNFTATATVIGSGGYAQGDSTASTAIYYNAATPPSADYSVSATIRISSTSSPLVGVIGRASSSASTFYQFFLDTAASAWKLQKTVAGTTTDLGSYSSVPSLNTDVDIRLDLEGSNIRCYVGGVQRIAVTDTAITAAGFAGVRLRQAGQIHSITAGDLVATIQDNPSAVTNGMWTWFTDPRAVSYNGNTYIGTVSSAGDVKITKINNATKSASSFTLAAALEIDDHDNPAIYIRPDGRIVAIYSRHNDTSGIRVRISTNAEDISAWGAESVISTGITLPVSYSNPFYLSQSNKLYNFFRSGPGGVGTNPIGLIESADGGSTWSSQTNFLTNTDQRPYVKATSNGADRIDFVITNCHPNEGAASVYHFYGQLDGTNVLKYYKTDGTLIGTSVTPANCTQIYDGTSNDAWVWDIAYGSDGHPRVLFVKFASTTDHRYMFSRWNGSAWTTPVEVATGGTNLYASEPYYSGGLAFDSRNTNVVYASRHYTSVGWVLHEMRTSDSGASWTKYRDIADPIPANQRNCRPYSPRNHTNELAVLWWSGSYTSYTSYSADVDYAANDTYADAAIAPAKGSLSLSGKTPTIAQSITVAPSVGHVTATGYVPTLDQPRTIVPATGRATATGYTPTVNQGAGQSLTPTTGHVAASGYAPSVTQSITVSPAAGRVTATGKQPTVSQDASVSVFPSTGRVTASGKQSTIEQPLTVAPTTAHALLTGNQPIVVQGASISPQTGHVSASSYAPTISQARTITVTAGQARVTGRIPTISQGIEIYSALRTLAIGAEVRVLSVNAENRIMALTAENRGLAG